LRAVIDNLISESTSYDDLLKRMESLCYKIKRGKHISFQVPEQERFTRAKSLGEGYSEDDIKSRIADKEITISKKELAEPTAITIVSITPPDQKPITITPAEKPAPIKPLLDIAGNPKYAQHRGLEQWAKLQNLKNTAAAFALVQEYGGFDAFNDLYTECRIKVETTENGIKANNEQIAAWGYLRDDISTYRRTLPIYKQ